MKTGQFRKMTNALMTALTTACAVLVVGVLALILFYLAARGISSLSWEFLTAASNRDGIGDALAESLIMTAVGAVVGLPLGIAVGVYLAEYAAGAFGSVLQFSVNMLAGVPTIIVGIFVYLLIVLPMGHASALAGGIALAIVMLPLIARVTAERLRLVPQNLREGALALGVPQWRVTRDIILPAAAPGIAAGALLAIARVCGETAPLLFITLGSRVYNFHLERPAALPVQIYSYAHSPAEAEHKTAWAAALVLMTLILSLNLVARILTRRNTDS